MSTARGRSGRPLGVVSRARPIVPSLPLASVHPTSNPGGGSTLSSALSSAVQPRPPAATKPLLQPRGPSPRHVSYGDTVVVMSDHHPPLATSPVRMPASVKLAQNKHWRFRAKGGGGGGGGHSGGMLPGSVSAPNTPRDPSSTRVLLDPASRGVAKAGPLTARVGVSASPAGASPSHLSPSRKSSAWGSPLSTARSPVLSPPIQHVESPLSPLVRRRVGPPIDASHYPSIPRQSAAMTSPRLSPRLHAAGTVLTNRQEQLAKTPRRKSPRVRPSIIGMPDLLTMQPGRSMSRIEKRIAEKLGEFRYDPAARRGLATRVAGMKKALRAQSSSAPVMSSSMARPEYKRAAIAERQRLRIERTKRAAEVRQAKDAEHRQRMLDLRHRHEYLASVRRKFERANGWTQVLLMLRGTWSWYRASEPLVIARRQDVASRQIQRAWRLHLDFVFAANVACLAQHMRQLIWSYRLRNVIYRKGKAASLVVLFLKQHYSDPCVAHAFTPWHAAMLKFRRRVVIAQRVCRAFVLCRRARLKALTKLWIRMERDMVWAQKRQVAIRERAAKMKEHRMTEKFLLQHSRSGRSHAFLQNRRKSRTVSNLTTTKKSGGGVAAGGRASKPSKPSKPSTATSKDAGGAFASVAEVKMGRRPTLFRLSRGEPDPPAGGEIEDDCESVGSVSSSGSGASSVSSSSSDDSIVAGGMDPESRASLLEAYLAQQRRYHLRDLADAKRAQQVSLADQLALARKLLQKEVVAVEPIPASQRRRSITADSGAAPLRRETMLPPSQLLELAMSGAVARLQKQVAQLERWNQHPPPPLFYLYLSAEARAQAADNARRASATGTNTFLTQTADSFEPSTASLTKRTPLAMLVAAHVESLAVKKRTEQKNKTQLPPLASSSAAPSAAAAPSTPATSTTTSTTAPPAANAQS